MRILLLNYEFPPIGGGGGHFSEDICRHLAARGHQIRVQTSHLKGLPRVEERDGFTIFRSPCLRRYAHTCTVPEMAAFLALNLLPAWRQATVWKPEVIYVHFAVPTGVLAWVIHRLRGIPYVLSAHLGDVPGAVPDQTERIFRWIKPMTAPIWQDAATVTVPNEYIRQLAWQSYQVPMETLPTGVDVAEMTVSPRDPRQPMHLVFAGRFNPQKNPLFLLELLRRLRDLDWRLDIVGDGPLLPEAKALAEKYGLTPHLTFHGWVTPRRLEAILSNGDILVMPSLMEGIPVVGMRALGAGLAVLGSRVGGIIDVVEEGRNGFLCPVNDSEFFEKCLRDMLNSPQMVRSMKEQSRKLAARFDLGHISRRLEEILYRATS